MSDPTPAPQAPSDSTAQTVDAVTDVLAWAVSLAFPAGAPVAALVNKVIDKATPWLAQVIAGKKISPELLAQMREHLNSLGPSFPEVGGYSNPYAGGSNPAPGTNPAQAPATTMTLTIHGVTVTVSGDTADAVIATVTKLVNK